MHLIQEIAMDIVNTNSPVVVSMIQDERKLIILECYESLCAPRPSWRC